MSGFCNSPLARRRVLYTDTIEGGQQAMRDDLWAVTTEELNYLHNTIKQAKIIEGIQAATIERLREQQDAQRPDFLLNGTRFKLNFSTRGNVDVFHNYASELQGRWVALVPAEDDMHLAPAAPLAADAVIEAREQASGKSLNAQVADLLRPYLEEGQKVIWREPFRWHDDNGVLSNHYDGFSIEGLAEDFNYHVPSDTNFNHAVIVGPRTPAAGAERAEAKDRIAELQAGTDQAKRDNDIAEAIRAVKSSTAQASETGE